VALTARDFPVARRSTNDEQPTRGEHRDAAHDRSTIERQNATRELRIAICERELGDRRADQRAFF
jgi:hypothetical protein